MRSIESMGAMSDDPPIKFGNFSNYMIRKKLTPSIPSIQLSSRLVDWRKAMDGAVEYNACALGVVTLKIKTDLNHVEKLKSIEPFEIECETPETGRIVISECRIVDVVFYAEMGYFMEIKGQVPEYAVRALKDKQLGV